MSSHENAGVQSTYPGGDACTAFAGEGRVTFLGTGAGCEAGVEWRKVAPGSAPILGTTGALHLATQPHFCQGATHRELCLQS